MDLTASSSGVKTSLKWGVVCSPREGTRFREQSTAHAQKSSGASRILSAPRDGLCELPPLCSGAIRDAPNRPRNCRISSCTRRVGSAAVRCEIRARRIGLRIPIRRARPAHRHARSVARGRRRGPHREAVVRAVHPHPHCRPSSAPLRRALAARSAHAGRGRVGVHVVALFRGATPWRDALDHHRWWAAARVGADDSLAATGRRRPDGLPLVCVELVLAGWRTNCACPAA